MKSHESSLFANTPINQEKISQIQALIDEANQLHQKARAIRASMQRFTEWLNEQEKQGDGN
jgi:predicted deacetylase